MNCFFFSDLCCAIVVWRGQQQAGARTGEAGGWNGEGLSIRSDGAKGNGADECQQGTEATR